MTCNKCGAELEEGVKFCLECGQAVPQTKSCIQCGEELPIKAKFCGECGTRQDGSATATSTLAMGDKNVVAGDVIGTKEETRIAGNATIIKNEDGTKKTDKCHVCGSIVLTLAGFECSRCGKFTCETCYYREQHACSSCLDNEKRLGEDRYKEALEQALADGVISVSERNHLEQLRRKYGLTQERATQLEREVQGSSGLESSLTTTDKLSLEKARDLFYKNGNAKKAHSLLEPLYKIYTTNEAVLNLYLPVLAVLDSQGAKKIADSLSIDCFCAYVVLVDIAIQNNDLREAELKLNAAKRLWPQRKNYLSFWDGLLNFNLYKKFGNVDLLNNAKKISTEFDESEDPLDLTQQIILLKILMEDAGEETAYLDRNFFIAEELYWPVLKKFCPINHNQL